MKEFNIKEFDNNINVSNNNIKTLKNLKSLIMVSSILIVFVISVGILFPSSASAETALGTSAETLTRALAETSTLSTADSQDEKLKVEYQKRDTEVIPDKYNTGARGDLSVFVADSGTFELIMSGQGNEHILLLKKSSAENTYNINFDAQNNQLSGEYEINNVDFSGYTLRTLKDIQVDHQIKITFNNCKFDWMAKDYFDSNVLYEFNNCSFRRFTGSNAVFNRCSFGGSYNDPLIPFRNVSVYDSYFSDLNYSDPEKVTHIDGTQIYGYTYTEGKTEAEKVTKELDVKDIKYYNCRFEVPNIQFDNNKATVNSCIMIQLEYANAHNIYVDSCILNGGGYTIYAHSKNGERLLENVSIKNTLIGDSKYFGAIYPDIDKNVVFDNISATDCLYVGSIFKENGKTMFSVSNDTKRERKLKIVTDKGDYDFTIPACPTRKELDDKTITKFSDMPVDIIKTIDYDCAYAICYDITDNNNIKQIRFVNYTDEDIYISKSIYGDSFDNPIILQGKCGENVSFVLTKDYILKITGSGKMDDYHSQKLPPWDDYKDYIKKIIIEEGITSVGNMAFKGCFGLESVELPKSLTKLGSRSFANCTTLKNIEIPETVEELGDNVFVGVAKPILEDAGNPDGASATGNGNNSSSSSKTNDIKASNDKANTDKNKLSVKNDKYKVGMLIKDKKKGLVYKVKKVKKTPELQLVKCTKKYRLLKLKSKIKLAGKKFRVTTIGAKALRKQKKLKKIILDKGIVDVKKGAFKGCIKLKVVVAKSKKINKKYLMKRGLNKSIKYYYR